MQNAKTGEPLPVVSVFASVPTQTERLVVVDATGELFTEICQRISALAPDRRERDWMVKMAKFLGDVAIEAGGGLENWSRHDPDAIQALLRGWYEAMSKWQKGDGRDELLALTSLVPETDDERDLRELAEADRVKAALEAFDDGGDPFPLETFRKALKTNEPADWLSPEGRERIMGVADENRAAVDAQARSAAEAPVVAGPTMESSDNGVTWAVPEQPAPDVDAEWPRSWDKWAPRPPRIDSLKDAMEYASNKCEMDTPWGREACDRLRKAAKVMNPVAVHRHHRPDPDPEQEIATLADAMAFAAARLPLDSRAAWAAADRLRRAAAIISGEPDPSGDAGQAQARDGWSLRNYAATTVYEYMYEGDLPDLRWGELEARWTRDQAAVAARPEESAGYMCSAMRRLAGAMPDEWQDRWEHAVRREFEVEIDPDATADLGSAPALTDEQVQALGQTIGHAVALSDAQLKAFRERLSRSVHDAISAALGRIPGDLFGRPFGLLTSDVRIVVRAIRELAARWQPSCKRDDVVAPEGWMVTSDPREAEALGGYAVHAASGFARALPCVEPAAVLSAAGWVLLVRCSDE